MLRKLFCYISVLICPFLAEAQLSLAKAFSSNMVLQRGMPIRVWGKGIPAQLVTVTFANRNIIKKVEKDSSWIVVFPKQKTNTLPQTIQVISGKEKIAINNVLIGDVWVCIGQSNMEFPIIRELNYATEISSLNQPLLRFYNPTYPGKNVYKTLFSDSIVQDLSAAKFYKGQWQSCDTNSFKTMSAVAYYFAKMIAANEHIPIGLLNISIGGAPLESFISVDALKNSARFSSKINGDWLKNASLPEWVRERGMQNVGGLMHVPNDSNGSNHSYKPGLAFEAGILPILPMPIKGILCYQGESNAQELDRVLEYGQLSALMINDLREKWNQPNLPFYYVQLSSMDTLKYKSQYWPEFRDEQRKMLSGIPNIAMAVSSDLGFLHDVHPTNKKAIGERLARLALKNSYFKNIVASGPLPKEAKYSNGSVTIYFKNAINGLVATDNKSVKGFSIDGENEVRALIKNSTIIIAVKNKPDAVYYGWKPFTDANLANKDLLPTSTFKLKVQ